MRHPKTRIAAPVLLAGFTLVLAACGGSDNRQNSLKPHGPAAQKINDLFIPILALACIIGVLVLGATIFAAIKFRHREGRPDNPKQVHGHTALEIGWTIVPALILAVVAVPTVATIWDLAERPKGPEVLKIDVVGHQWWWEFQLPKQPLVPQATKIDKAKLSSTGPVLTATELHIPVGTKVDVGLNSADVIHSFWIPELNGKKDVMPARTNRLTLEASEPGTYLGACAEYCGLSHAGMRMRVIAEPMAKWKAWLARVSGPPAQPSGPDTAVGKLISTTYKCANCHNFDSVFGSNYGPNLTHLASRSTFAGGAYKLNRTNLLRWVKDAPSMVAMQSKECRRFTLKEICNGMPSFIKNTPPGEKVMTNEDANAIVDFLLGEK